MSHLPMLGPLTSPSPSPPLIFFFFLLHLLVLLCPSPTTEAKTEFVFVNKCFEGCRTPGSFSQDPRVLWRHYDEAGLVLKSPCKVTLRVCAWVFPSPMRAIVWVLRRNPVADLERKNRRVLIEP